MGRFHRWPDIPLHKNAPDIPPRRNPCRPATLGWLSPEPIVTVDEIPADDSLWIVEYTHNVKRHVPSDTLWVARKRPMLYPWTQNSRAVMAIRRITSSGCLQLTVCESALQYLFGERILPIRDDNSWLYKVTRKLDEREWAPINQIDYRADNDERFYNYYDLYYDH